MDIGGEGALTNETRTSRTSRNFALGGTLRTSLWCARFLCQSVDCSRRQEGQL